jgi:hypothetical protein
MWSSHCLMNHYWTPTNICYYVFLILVGLNFVLCIRVSKLHLSYLTPPNSVILKISSLGNSPSLVNQHELFHLTNTGELKLKCDISEFLGKTFITRIHKTKFNPTRIKNTPRHHKLLEAAILLILSIPDH